MKVTGHRQPRESQPRDRTAKRSHSQEISRPRDLTAKGSHSREVSQPRDLTAKRITAKRCHSQEISAGKVYQGYICSGAKRNAILMSGQPRGTHCISSNFTYGLALQNVLPLVRLGVGLNLDQLPQPNLQTETISYKSRKAPQYMGPGKANLDRCKMETFSSILKTKDEVTRHHRLPTATKRAAKCNLCRACHAKHRSMSPSATPAT